MGAVTIRGGGISIILPLELIQMMPGFELKLKIQAPAQALQGSCSGQRCL